MSSPEALPKLAVVKVEMLDKHVAHVELNRPTKANAFNGEMWRDFRLAFEHVSKHGDVRAVIVSGAGRMFTAGLDIKDQGQMQGISGDASSDAARRAFHLRNLILHLQDTFNAMERCPAPVIVCAHGPSIGAAVDLMSAADIRFCTKDAYFSIKEVDVGLAADVGTLQRIEHVVGNSSLVRELAYTARSMPAAEALSCGFVSRVFDTKEQMLAAALQMARTIASKSPVAVAGTKHNLNYARGRPVEDALAHMALYNAAALQTDDVAKSALASISKGEPPEFSKL